MGLKQQLHDKNVHDKDKKQKKEVHPVWFDKNLPSSSLLSIMRLFQRLEKGGGIVVVC
jgi:hypothetical protein